MIKKLYDKCVKWAGYKYAKPILAIEAFIESSFFPIPPDVMIIPMVIAKRSEFIKIALIATIFSVLGALFAASEKKRALANLQPHQFIYCIEGPSCRLNDIRKKIIDGALINTMFRDKLRVITTHSVMDTVQLILNLVKKVRENPMWFEISSEIDDESSSKNYSYFFYKGAYSTIAGENQ